MFFACLTQHAKGHILLERPVPNSWERIEASETDREIDYYAGPVQSDFGGKYSNEIDSHCSANPWVV